jgi:Putative Actinobacterial Holin-X, holin superfamily III
MASRQKETDELSIPELVRQLADETTTLVRQELDLARAEAARAADAVVTLAKQELQLAKAEMKQKGRQAGPGIGMMGVAAGMGLLAGGALTAFLILVLDEAMTTWLAALLVGLAYAAVAGALFVMGKARVQEAGPFVPEQTIETVKEDIEWAKTQVGSESK